MQVLGGGCPVEQLAAVSLQPSQRETGKIRQDDLLILGLAAANHDPLVRPDPQMLTGNQAYMSFSNGEHGCPYAAQEIAKVIAEAAIEVLLDRLPDVLLAVPADTLTWRPSPLFRGLSTLPVKFTRSRRYGVIARW
ncbi:cytochrome P450 [Kibdelosporangium banguiense]|uniref:Cytochrome P450 n=1 Tax=Kibdelosporangium banguiense TaxID=1365924 RepID=A0ABS4TXC2_9PSEU|nr:cytochrome P450 [Kibdelosporangium banguiense]